MGWARGWKVRLHVLEDRYSQREAVREFMMFSVAELRHAVEKGRADPAVRKCEHHVCYRLDDTDQPDRCQCGRPLHGTLAVRALRSWMTCNGCPGHFAYRCRSCDQVTVWPAVTYACGIQKRSRFHG